MNYYDTMEQYDIWSNTMWYKKLEYKGIRDNIMW